MQYKAIVLELLQDQYPSYHEQLRSTRTLLPTLGRHAAELRRAHLAWTDELARENPGRDPAQVKAEALELAIHHLQGDLPPESPPDEATEAFSIGAAMDFLRRHTPPA